MEFTSENKECSPESISEKLGIDAVTAYQALEYLYNEDLINGIYNASDNYEMWVAVFQGFTMEGHDLVIKLKDDKIMKKALKYLKDNGIPIAFEALRTALFISTL